ncbi:MAG TPA: hypothetical protein VMM78_02985 [Thermomicrobiales bacterium]|nr:hypothetical protein [Thermomicrobiales bacterium]
MLSNDNHTDATSKVLNLETGEEYECELAALEAAGIPHRALGGHAGGLQNLRGDAPPQRQQSRIVVYPKPSDLE